MRNVEPTKPRSEPQPPIPENRARCSDYRFSVQLLGGWRMQVPPDREGVRIQESTHANTQHKDCRRRVKNQCCYTQLTSKNHNHSVNHSPLIWDIQSDHTTSQIQDFTALYESQPPIQHRETRPKAHWYMRQMLTIKECHVGVTAKKRPEGVQLRTKKHFLLSVMALSGHRCDVLLIISICVHVPMSLRARTSAPDGWL